MFMSVSVFFCVCVAVSLCLCLCLPILCSFEFASLLLSKRVSQWSSLSVSLGLLAIHGQCFNLFVFDCVCLSLSLFDCACL